MEVTYKESVEAWKAKWDPYMTAKPLLVSSPEIDSHIIAQVFIFVAETVRDLAYEDAVEQLGWCKRLGENRAYIPIGWAYTDEGVPEGFVESLRKLHPGVFAEPEWSNRKVTTEGVVLTEWTWRASC